MMTMPEPPLPPKFGKDPVHDPPPPPLPVFWVAGVPLAVPPAVAFIP